MFSGEAMVVIQLVEPSYCGATIMVGDASNVACVDSQDEDRQVRNGALKNTLKGN